MAQEQEYQVVARRYRPQNFGELIGQEHIARALANAIQNNRIGHAYLFTGARGVGKTSSARIFAKSLNCVHGPTSTPCGTCEICQGITAGDDLDVIEIDGASNRGIDQIRTLIQNVNVRPVRARFKIYIIDEVHMLTNEAFNALLKTLEEPPEHVKFIFCTTEVNKIPITILSRCQRFDFAGIDTLAIANRLQTIVESEGLMAEPEAIRLLARRANGSMRDGQSLLEQLLAFTSGTITLQDVHNLLGTANDEVLIEFLRNIVQSKPAPILRLLDVMLQQGADPGQLLEQLFGCLRDLMAILAGCGSESFLFLPPDLEDEVRNMADRIGLDSILMAMQIVDHTLTRMKISTQGRLLTEMAFVRLCSLQNLDDLGSLVTQIQAEREKDTVALPSPALPQKPSNPTPGYKPIEGTARSAGYNSTVVNAPFSTSTQSQGIATPSKTRQASTQEPTKHETQDEEEKKTPFVTSQTVSPMANHSIPTIPTTPAISSTSATRYKTTEVEHEGNFSEDVSEDFRHQDTTQDKGGNSIIGANLSPLQKIQKIRNIYLSVLKQFPDKTWVQGLDAPKDVIIGEGSNDVTVLYSGSYEFGLSQFLRNGNDLKRLEAMLRAAVGAPALQLHLVLEQKTDGGGNHQVKRRGMSFQELYENPLIHAAEELFGAVIQSSEAYESTK